MTLKCNKNRYMSTLLQKNFLNIRDRLLALFPIQMLRVIAAYIDVADSL